jgi:hypothetical protein
MHAAEFTLHDPDGPLIAKVGGRLGSTTAHSGVELLSISATDSGSGVYRTVLEVDGQVVSASMVDSNDGRCADAGPDPKTPREFLYRVPCKLSASYDVPFDTRKLEDGRHTFRALVEDASGNRTVAWSSQDFVVRNGAPPSSLEAGAVGASAGGRPAGTTSKPVNVCGTGSGLSARFARNDSGSLTVEHGSPFSVAGRAPANADIDVFHLRGSKATRLGSARTSTSGTFSTRLDARHGSGTIRICGEGIATSLTLRVKAKVSLKVRISNGGLVRYAGRVATGYIPKGGKIVAIQGKAGPSWQTFALRRTNKSGRFKGRYRLRVVRPGVKLKFRVRVPSEAGYPFVGVVGKGQTKRVR